LAKTLAARRARRAGLADQLAPRRTSGRCPRGAGNALGKPATDVGIWAVIRRRNACVTVRPERDGLHIEPRADGVDSIAAVAGGADTFGAARADSYSECDDGQPPA
jgi:hypothetical protein